MKALAIVLMVAVVIWMVIDIVGLFRTPPRIKEGGKKKEENT